MTIGWTDSHLHRFVAGDTCYGMADVDAPEDELDEAQYGLRDLPARFSYEYDFGDGWEHDVEVLGAGDGEPGLTYGEGRCPPEDCGGPHGYALLLEALANRQHPDHEAMRRWAGDLEAFDAQATDLLIRQTVGEVPATVRLLLELTAPGIKLTPGARLPRAIVRQVQEHRPEWHLLDHPAAIEDDLLPLGALHDVLRQSGLLRLSRGVLRPTRAAADDLQVIRRLRSWFEAYRFAEIVATDGIALVVAHGPLTVEDLAQQVHRQLGWGWSTAKGQPVAVRDVRMALDDLGPVLRGLDLINPEERSWTAGPSALTLLPRATALAAYWAQPTHEKP